MIQLDPWLLASTCNWAKCRFCRVAPGRISAPALSAANPVRSCFKRCRTAAGSSEVLDLATPGELSTSKAKRLGERCLPQRVAGDAPVARPQFVRTASCAATRPPRGPRSRAQQLRFSPAWPRHGSAWVCWMAGWLGGLVSQSRAGFLLH